MIWTHSWPGLLGGNRVWLNQDPSHVSLSVDVPTVGEESGVATISALLSAPTNRDVILELGFGGTARLNEDYDVSSEQIVVPAGESGAAITVTAKPDLLDEPDETVVVEPTTITGAVGGGQVTVTILDDDEAVVPDVTLLVDNASIPEAAGLATLTVRMSEPTTADVTVGLAISGSAGAADFSISGTEIVILAGSTSGSITVTAVQDTDDEVDETVVVDIVSIVGGNEDGTQQVTITIVDDDVPPGFMVSSLTGTNSGFVVEFSASVDASDLNLYDAFAVGAGAADLVVEGAVVGGVAGSIAVTGPSVTFVATGGTLAADTYSVTLRSAADGFKDDTGRLLDGNADGIPGGDFAGTFEVADPVLGSVTLSLPDVVRGPGQEVNIPATSAGLPLMISEGAGVRSVTASVDFDANILTISGAAVGPNMPAGSTVIVDVSSPGTAVITFTSPVDLPAGENVLVNITASVPTVDANEIFGTQGVLDLHSAAVTDSSANLLPVIDDDAIHLVRYFGDVSGTGRVNAADAAQVARVAALLDEAFASSLTTDPLVVADITGNSRLNAADASRVARFAALIPVAEIPAIPTLPASAVAHRVGEPRFPIRRERTGEVADKGTSRLPMLLVSASRWEPGYHRAVDAVIKPAADLPISAASDQEELRVILEDAIEGLLAAFD